MDLMSYYDDAVTNTLWWFDHGRVESDDDTPHVVFYLYDHILLGNNPPAPGSGTGGVVTATVLGDSIPVLVWITDRELILVDPRPDKQTTYAEDIVPYTLAMISRQLNLSYSLVLSHARASTFKCPLRVENEIYTPTLIHVTFNFSMTDTLRYWREELRDNPYDKPEPLEPV